MVYVVGVQKLIYFIGFCYDYFYNCFEFEGGWQFNNVSVWVQLLVYILFVIVEILGFVIVFEYVYSKVLREMKIVV